MNNVVQKKPKNNLPTFSDDELEEGTKKNKKSGSSKHLILRGIKGNGFVQLPDFVYNVLVASKNAAVVPLVIQLYKRQTLSSKNRNFWENDDECFFIYKQTDLADDLGVDERTIRAGYKVLKELQIIDVVPQGLGRPAKLYFNSSETVYEAIANNKELMNIIKAHEAKDTNDFMNHLYNEVFNQQY
ncbi:hypothetical protein OF376_01675 [Ureaplasma miroungigenitalium]|uniref:Uncharacterized protein n=1 Tax=Ureaplasma miroungigenitalium TaxID=1042321 RepID=A0ABT3BMJ4_9BACT|nr:hypothetical protein [Ureaplasma miroungigenitalium]MCV3728474.1 hypothetical protein [Ureaplasma miroungigenitalium]